MKLKGMTKLNKPLKALSVRAVLLGVSVLLLLSSIIYFTVAWYTKMVGVSGLKFQAAKWDFTANYAITDVTVNVYEYSTLEKKRAAPGTAGWIQLDLAARQADTDIEYMISIDRSTMSDEFKDRIFFYYLEADGTEVYFDGKPGEPNANDNYLKGTIEKNGEETVYIYWKWIYEAPESVVDPLEREKWDEFDTEVGKNPELYANDMNAEVSIVGVEVNPENNRVPTTP